MKPVRYSTTKSMCCVLVCLGICFVSASTSAVSSDEKKPKPDAGQITEGRKLAQEIYQQRWDEATSTIQKSSLARQVIRDAENGVTGTPNYYALLVIAQQMAIVAGDVATVMDAIDHLAAQFELDDVTMRCVALTELSARVDAQSQRRLLVDCCLQTAVQAIAGDQFDVAREMSGLASTEAPKAGDDGLIKESEQCQDVVSLLQREFPDVQKARADLARNPTDPTASRIAGRYECFCKREWAQGIALLVQSDDDALRQLATQSCAKVDSPETAMLLGNAWWQIAEHLEGWQQDTVRAYAATLYKQADGKLSGFDKQVVDKRLGEVGNSTYLALSRRFTRKSVPDVKPTPRRKPRQEDASNVVKGPSKAEDWNTVGKWRHEGEGIRLFGGRSILESKHQFVGEFAITIRYVITGANRGAQQLWVEMWGECFAFERPEGIAILQRKGNVVQFAWTQGRPRVIMLKDPEASLPSTIKIHIGTRDIWNDKTEMLIPLIQLEGVVAGPVTLETRPR